ncbi:hypothetical protein PIB30_085028 [Stylosanthes scabra]|uniref:Putative plant transposon protein domain-containing protein n=1 Tax=Stylosanthes scabra TaxID=79078 RepID=A0ABU6TU33_9FABA|nr:hypothetical protein [Stylosanthes scabra]
MTLGAETDFKTRQYEDQRLDEVIRDICMPGAQWKMSSSQPPHPIQLRRQDLTPVARGRAEFIIHSMIPTGNKSEITVARAVLIHSIIKGHDVRVEELIADNIAVLAEGVQGRKLASMKIRQEQFFENMQKAQSQYLDELKSLRTRQDEMEKEQKEAWKARKEENIAIGQKQNYSIKYGVLMPRRHYPRLGVAKPQGLFSLIHHPTPRRDTRCLGVDEAARKRTLHQGLNA